MNKKRILQMVECAMIVAVAFIIDLLPLPKWPQGGSVSLGMIPIVFFSFRHGALWGTLSGFLLSVVGMIMGVSLPPANTVLSIVLCILLDYILAFAFLGTADLFRRPFKSNSAAGYIAGTVAAGLLRLLCSFLSGIFLWGSYAPEGVPVWFYSLTYNAGYMIPNTVVAVVVILILCKVINPKTLKKV